MRRKSTFEEQLDQYGYCSYYTVGSSMLPLLRPRKDLVHLKKPSGRLKCYDVALFRRANGQYVLHRIIKVRESDYVFLGDNQIHREYGIRDSQILGVMTGFTRNGKFRATDALWYRFYVFAWRGLYPLRYLWRRVRE